MGEDLVDHRRLREKREDTHDAVARRAREGINFEELNVPRFGGASSAV
jgi:hypothetical protein